MATAAKQAFAIQANEISGRNRQRCEVVQFEKGPREPESTGENFSNELEALGRRYLAACGHYLTGSGEEASSRVSTRMATKYRQ